MSRKRLECTSFAEPVRYGGISIVLLESGWAETRANEVDTINKGSKCPASMRFINHSGSFLKIERRAKRDVMGI